MKNKGSQMGHSKKKIFKKKNIKKKKKKKKDVSKQKLLKSGQNQVKKHLFFV